MLEKPEPVRHCRPGISARQSQHVGPPPAVIGLVVGPPQSSWPTIGYCISGISSEARVIWYIKKRSEPCDPPGGTQSTWARGDSQRKGAISAGPEPQALRGGRESEGSGGKTWENAKAGTVQEPCR